MTREYYSYPSPEEQERQKRRAMEIAREAGYVGWHRTLYTQVEQGALTMEDVHAMVARALLTRDIVGDREYHNARTDQLTQLGNRRLFDEQYEKLTGNDPVGLILIDLDHFKAFNTMFGHTGGDEVLVQTALRITSQVRQINIVKPGGVYHRRTEDTSDVATRWGGEEFAILMPGLSDSGKLYQRAEQIRTVISDTPFSIGRGGTQAIVTASIGAGIFTGGDRTAFLQGVSKDALLQAKDNGRNRTQLYIPK